MREMSDEDFERTDREGYLNRHFSSLNWVMAMTIVMLQRVTELASDKIENRGWTEASVLVDIFRKTQEADTFEKRGLQAFITAVIKTRPELKPFTSEIRGTAGLISVLGAMIANKPDDTERKVQRDDPDVIWQKIKAKWHYPVLAIDLAVIWSTLDLKKLWLENDQLNDAVQCLGHLTATQDRAMQRKQRSEFRIIHALRKLISLNAITFGTLIENKWQISLAAERMRCWPRTLYNELLAAVREASAEPIAPEDLNWRFIREVAVRAFPNYVYGIAASKALRLSWASNEQPWVVYGHWKTISSIAAKDGIRLLDTLVFARLKPIQNSFLLHGQYNDQSVTLRAVTDLVTDFFEHVFDAPITDELKADWGDFPTRAEALEQAAATARIDAPGPYRLNPHVAKIWWTLPDFKTPQETIEFGFQRLREDAPYLAATLSKLDFDANRLPEDLAHGGLKSHKKRIVTAILGAATCCGAKLDILWNEIKRSIRATHGGFPVCATPDAERASWGFPATAEFGHWARALASSGETEEFIQIVPMRMHLVMVAELAPTDLDGLLYLKFADHPKVDKPFFLNGFSHQRKLAQRLRDLKPDLKVKGPESVTSPGLADYLTRNDVHVRELLRQVPIREQLRANEMFAWTTSFGFNAPTVGGGQPVAWGHLITTANVRQLRGERKPKWRTNVYDLLKQAGSPTVANVSSDTLDDYLKQNHRFDADALGPRYRNVSPEATDSVTVNRSAMSRSIRGGEKTSIYVERAGPNGAGAFVTFEEMLPLRFPLLFTTGNVPTIAGETLHEKAMSLLKIFDPGGGKWVGLANFVGPVAASLHLYLFTLIEEGRVTYRMSMEKYNTHHDEGEQLSVRELRDINLPTFDAYWKHLRHDAQGLYALHGAPCLMLTFTANEHQLPEPYRVEIERFGFSVAGSDAAPIRAMYFAEQTKKLRALNWKSFCNDCGLPPPKGYCWRVEVQSRGNPHQHLCLFLGDAQLDNATLDRICSAHWPPLGTTAFQLVKGLHVHKCGERCKNVIRDPVTGEAKTTCSFHFPHPQTDVHLEQDGWHELPRKANESWLSEWLAIGVMGLEAHSHCRIVCTSDESAISYVLGYCFKTEAPTRYVDNRSELSKVLSARTVPLSLATHMIFSNWVAAVSEHVKTLPLVHPSRETAEFRRRDKEGVIVCGLNPMRQYFARSRAFEQMTYGEFHSQVLVRKRKPGDRVPREGEAPLGPDDQLSPSIGSLEHLRPNLFGDFAPEQDPGGAGEYQRAGTEADDQPAEEHDAGDDEADDGDEDAEARGATAFPVHTELMTDAAGRYAKTLVQVKRRKRQLISYRALHTRSTVDDVAFAAVITAGPWRSYEQAKCGKATWVDAAIHLGLFGEETVRPDGCIELVKQLVLRQTLDARSVALTIANLQDEFPLLDPTRLLHYAFSHDEWGHQAERLAAIEKYLPEALEDAGQLREQLSADDDEVNELLHLNSKLDVLQEDRRTLHAFMHKATAEQVQVLAWLAQRRADEHDYLEVIEYAQQCARKDITFDPSDWHHLQRVLFCVGPAGTGKSFVIKACIAWLRLKNVPFIVLGSTGCAAAAIDGVTLHSAGSLYGDDDQIRSSLTLDTPRGRALAMAEVILTDEFGMISMGTAKGLSSTLDRLCRQLHKLSMLMPERLPPFADKIMLFYGDLMQLPSVHPGESDSVVAQRQIQLADIFADGDVIALRQNMRVSPDDAVYMAFVNLARQQREARLTRELIDAIRPLIIDVGDTTGMTTEEVLEAQVKAVARHLANHSESRSASVTHASADEMLQAVNKIKAEEQHIEFTHISSNFLSGHGIITWIRANDHFWIRNVIGTKAKTWQQNWFERQMKNPYAKMSRTVPLELDLHVGQKVRIQRNVSMKRKIVNGTEAVVEDFIYGVVNGQRQLLAVQLKLADGKSFALPRKQIASVYTWRGDPISRLMYPCSVLQQSTVNALQGATIKEGILFLCLKDRMTRNALYVAFTRLTRMHQLVIYGITPEQLDEYEMRVNEEIDAISDRFDVAADAGWTVTHQHYGSGQDAVVFPQPLPNDPADQVILEAWLEQAQGGSRVEQAEAKDGVTAPNVDVTQPVDEQFQRAVWGFLPGQELTAALLQAQSSRRRRGLPVRVHGPPAGQGGASDQDEQEDDGDVEADDHFDVAERIAELQRTPQDQLTSAERHELKRYLGDIETAENEIEREEEVEWTQMHEDGDDGAPNQARELHLRAVADRIAVLDAIPTGELTAEEIEDLINLQMEIAQAYQVTLIDQESENRRLEPSDGDDDELERLSAPPDVHDKPTVLPPHPRDPPGEQFLRQRNSAHEPGPLSRAGASAAFSLLNLVQSQVDVFPDTADKQLVCEALAAIDDLNDPPDDILTEFGFPPHAQCDAVDVLAVLSPRSALTVPFYYLTVGRDGEFLFPPTDADAVIFALDRVPAGTLLPRGRCVPRPAAASGLEPPVMMLLTAVIFAERGDAGSTETWLYAPACGDLAWRHIVGANVYEGAERNLSDRLSDSETSPPPMLCLYSRAARIPGGWRSVESLGPIGWWNGLPNTRPNCFASAPLHCLASIRELRDAVQEHARRGLPVAAALHAVFKFVREGTGTDPLPPVALLLGIQFGDPTTAADFVKALAERLSREVNRDMIVQRTFIDPDVDEFLVRNIWTEQPWLPCVPEAPRVLVADIAPRDAPLRILEAHGFRVDDFAGRNSRPLSYELIGIVALREPRHFIAFVREGGSWTDPARWWLWDDNRPQTCIADSEIRTLLAGEAGNCVVAQLFYRVLCAEPMLTGLGDGHG